MRKNLLLKSFVLFAFLLSGKVIVFAQSVAINTSGNVANASSMLDVESTTKGLLIPRVSLTATNVATPITTPATSLLVYNIATSGVYPNNVYPGYYYFNGTVWVRFMLSNDAWQLLGNNAITNPALPTTYGVSTIGAAENFLGTRDARDLVLGTNNLERMRILNNGQIAIGVATTSNRVQINAPNDTALQVLSVGQRTNGISVALVGTNLAANAWGIGGAFNGSYYGTYNTVNGGNYNGDVFGTVNLAYGAVNTGTRTAGFFAASSGQTNRAIITGGGNIGFGTFSPSQAFLQSHGMIGNTSALFKSAANNSAGIALISDWPGIYFNSYYNGNILAMGNAGYPAFINGNQANGWLEFGTTDVANTTANAVVAVPTRMRITGAGQVSIGQDNFGNITPNADLWVANPATADADVPVFTARHSGVAGTTWRMGSIEYYTEGLGNIGFSTAISPLGGNGGASLGYPGATRYDGFRWGTLYTTTNPNVSSDITLKKEIKNTPYGLHQLRNIQPISYKLINNKINGLTVADADQETYIGFNAQELKNIIPEVVTATSLFNNFEDGTYTKVKTDKLGVRYGDMIPVTINAIKELDTEVQKIAQLITVTDFGIAKTNTDGVVQITYTPEFLAQINGTPVISLTPMQANAGLYISNITAVGFEVRNNQPNTVNFSWVAMAKVAPTHLAVPNKINPTEFAQKLAKLNAEEAALPTLDEAKAIVSKKQAAQKAATAVQNTNQIATAEAAKNKAMQAAAKANEVQTKINEAESQKQVLQRKHQ
jgi:hypothetical protein